MITLSYIWRVYFWDESVYMLLHIYKSLMRNSSLNGCILLFVKNSLQKNLIYF